MDDRPDRFAANARYRASPAGKAARAAAKARYKQSPAGKAAKARERTSARAARKITRRFSRKLASQERDRAPFVGCDGEGVGRGANHKYVLFRMGERELYNGGARLTTPELLQFILEHPRGDKLAGFAFEYDITCILADVSEERRAHMIATYQQKHAPGEKRKDGGKRWTWLDFSGYGRFGVNWLSRNHLKVCRPSPDPKNLNGSDRQTIRTIEDSWGNFGESFLKSIKAWGVGAEHWATIEAMKDARATFETITPEIQRYNAIECELLAEMMTKFRAVCFDCGIRPKTWNGAGKIAAFLHHLHGTLRAADLAKLCPKSLIEMAHAGYYGGRFEITRAGLIDEPVYEHDVNSAYPDAMRSLPCLVHGKWKHTGGEVLRDSPADAIFICPVRFEHPPIVVEGKPRETFLCGLPFRAKKDGRLSWPQRGNGVYWSRETRSAERRGAVCEYRAGWLYEKRCDCRPFDWVEKLYIQRKALPGERGLPLKRGINSLYGKLAQRIGEPPFANPIWAGLITAHLRSALNDAIGMGNPRNVIMMATDSLYTIVKPLKVKAGGGLGEWSRETYPSLFIVQPGLYWAAGKIKSRGVSPVTIKKFAPDFEAVWSRWAANRADYDNAYEILRDRIATADDPVKAEMLAMRAWAAPLYPLVKIVFDAFIGLRLAAHWGKPELAGTWMEMERKISFDWSGKRDSDHEWSADGKAVILGSRRGSPYEHSAHYTAGGTLTTAESWEAERMLFEAMPGAAELIELFTDE
jgi:hypothetical protein